MELDKHYLFSYFKKNGADGLHLAYSNDGFNWKPLNKGKSILKPMVGKNKLMRDPCLILGKDCMFHMVWTVGWGDLGIGIAHSKDLITWSKQEYIPVMNHEPTTLNCWAPEIFYDEDTEKYMILWSSTIPGRFPETEKSGDFHGKHRLNHRIYYTTTTDFKDYTPTALLYDGGFNVIDASIVKHENKFVMITKDETRHPVAKNLRIAMADKAEGPYSSASEPFTQSWVEGPCLLKIEDKWILFFDRYIKNTYGCMMTENFNQWEDFSSELKIQRGTRHGFALEIPPNKAFLILEKYPPSEWNKLNLFNRIKEWIRTSILKLNIKKSSIRIN